MIWRGKELKTYGDIGAAIAKVKTRQEAAEFFRLYEAETPHARSNIGYLSGYYDSKTAARILRLFDTAHPVFGRSRPTSAEAFAAGKRLAKKR